MQGFSPVPSVRRACAERDMIARGQNLVTLLLKHGAKPSEQDHNGDSPLLCACRMGHTDVVKVRAQMSRE